MREPIPRFCCLCGTATVTRSIDGWRPWDNSLGLIPVCDACPQTGRGAES